MVLGIGLDLVCVDEVQEAICVHGRRYLDRVYTERELLESREDPARLATRFAMKEATMKALGHGDEPMPWRSIGLQSDAAGLPCVSLSGASAEWAARRGVGALRVSVAQFGNTATAVVLAESAR